MVVDDILVRGPPTATAEFYRRLAGRFDMKDPTYLTHDTPITYPGLHITLFDKAGDTYISIDQQVDLENYLADIGITETNVVANPMSCKSEILSNPELLLDEDAAWYRSVVGALNYYACATRYDTAYPTSVLSQYSCRPTRGAKKALLRVLAYLACTSEFSLTGKFGGRHDDLEAYSDSDMAGNQARDTRSQTGIMLILNGAPVHWRSAKQPVTAISSACAEIYALSECVKHARLLTWRGHELGVGLDSTLNVQVDNAQAKSFAEGTCVQSKLRGTFNVRDGWVQELRDRHHLIVSKVDTVNNCADLLTKVHKTARFKQLLSMIGSKLARRCVVERAMLSRVLLGNISAA